MLKIEAERPIYIVRKQGTSETKDKGGLGVCKGVYKGWQFTVRHLTQHSTSLCSDTKMLKTLPLQANKI